MDLLTSFILLIVSLMNQNSRRTKAKPFRAARGNSTSVKKNEIMLIKSSPRQVVWDAWLPGLPVKATTIVTTGVIATVYSINTSQIQAFSTRFGSTFDEFRIVQANLRLSLFSSTNAGLILVFIDENSSAAPTVAEARERSQRTISASAVDRNLTLNWIAADPADLLYTPIANSFTPASFKMYTDNANFGSSIVATDYFEITCQFRVQFRGLQGV